MAGKSKTIRAVVVDDSPTARGLIVALLQGEQGIEVVGVGASGEEAIRLVKRLKPDVLAMDIRMKGMDGLEATRQIMRESPLPIVLITSSFLPEDNDITFRAMKAGALNVVKKPGLAEPEACSNLVQTVRLMAGLPVVHHWGREEYKPRPVTGRPAITTKDIQMLPQRIKVIGIASSTGGPAALATIFGALSAGFPWPVLVVQHVTPGFGPGMAQWLNTQTALPVRLARHGEVPQPGVILIAPDDYHMTVDTSGAVSLTQDQPYKGLRPSANYLFKSLAERYGSSALGIILTGMGNDGANGIDALYRAGGFTIAQDEKSCIVYGMPRAAVEQGSIAQVLPIDEIARTLSSLAQQKNNEVCGA